MVMQNQPQSLVEAIKPYEADDCHKGTFLVLRVAGMAVGEAVKVVDRKVRGWQNWRSMDERFRELDDQIPLFQKKFGGEARILRTAMLDIHIIEAGNYVLKRIIRKERISDAEWTYAVKMAGLRIPLMGAKEESGNPWEVLANRIQHTLTEQKTLQLELNADGKPKMVTASETKQVMEVRTEEQRQKVEDIVSGILNGKKMGMQESMDTVLPEN